MATKNEAVAKKSTAEKNSTSMLDSAGHRKRLRQRFLRDCGENMHDYELLELMLTFAVPRQNLKPLAKRLITRFGSFADVVSAEQQELENVEGIAESSLTIIKLITAAAERLLAEEVQTDVVSSWQQIVNLCRARSARMQVEQFRVLFLDKRNRIIKDEIIQQGTIDTTAVYPREIIKRALNYGASGMVLAHNHPSGDITPSIDDIELTRAIKRIAEDLGMTLHDHIIVSREGHTSFKSRGLL